MGKNIMFTLMFIASMISNVEATTIKNLERTRANTLAVILDMNINPNQRIQKVEKARLKLLDMERITINDSKLSKNPSQYAVKAFENFDLTFLVHASLEKDKSLAVHWFEEVGFTTSNLKRTKAIRK